MTTKTSKRQRDLPFQSAAAEKPSSRRTLIRASAGTGKTFQLSNRYLALLREAPAERILAVTFTRKAAGEILERVLLRLARAILDPHALEELQQFIGSPPIQRKECLLLLKELTASLHRVKISTLDAFFARLATAYALELGLPAGWRILEETDVAGLRQQAIDEVLNGQTPQDTVQLMHLLDKGNASRSVSGMMQQTIVEFYAVFLMSRRESWDRFGTAQFLSEEAREELLRRLQAIPCDGKAIPKAVAQDCEALRTGRWDDLLGKGLMKKILDGETTYSRARIPSAFEEPYRSLAEHIRAEILTIWKHQTLATWELLSHFHQAFSTYKQELGGLQFDDVALSLAEAAQDGRSLDMAFRLDAAMDHLLLDEFQDTSLLQWMVLNPFAKQMCAGDATSFFCVGDTKQAIYGWRGGEAAIFDTIEQELPGLETRQLSQSFRSSPVIMQTVNQAMTGLRNHENLDEFTETMHAWCHTFPAHTTARTDLPGYARLVVSPATEDDSDDGTTTRDQVQSHWTYVAEEVARLAKEAPLASIGVLTRSNQAVGRLLFELTHLGVDASEEGGNPITDSAAVQLLLSLISLADHPGNTVAAFHVACSPLGAVLRFEKWEDSDERLRLSLNTRDRLLREGYGSVISSLIPGLQSECDGRELRRLVQLASLGDVFTRSGSTLRPSEFIDFVSTQRQSEPNRARVRVMNIHQAKGLEFDIVVLPELDKPMVQASKYVTRSATPGGPVDLVALSRNESHFDFLGGELAEARAQTRNRELQEALCLLYVGMTRAVHALHMMIMPKTTAKLPKTAAGLLRAGLAEGAEATGGEILFEAGDVNWFRQQWPDQVVRKSKKARGPEPEIESRPEILFKAQGGRRRMPRLAPSRVAGEDVTSFRSLLGAADDTGRNRGTLFHRWLEQVTWSDESHLHEELALRIGHECGFTESATRAAYNDFEQALIAKEIRALLDRSSDSQFSGGGTPEWLRKLVQAGTATLQVRHEMPFSMLESTGLISGTIDRLVLVIHENKVCFAEVVDFKTDTVADDPKSLGDKVRIYQPQLQYYRQAVRNLYGLKAKEVSLKLAFLACGRVVDASQVKARGGKA